jgi:hypothetical protein
VPNRSNGNSLIVIRLNQIDGQMFCFCENFLDFPPLTWRFQKEPLISIYKTL